MTQLRTGWAAGQDRSPDDPAPVPVGEAETTDRFAPGTAGTGEDHRTGTESAEENLGSDNDGSVWPPDPPPVDNPVADRGGTS